MSFTESISSGLPWIYLSSFLDRVSDKIIIIILCAIPFNGIVINMYVTRKVVLFTMHVPYLKEQCTRGRTKKVKSLLVCNNSLLSGDYERY